MTDFHILRIQCADRQGLISVITVVIFSNRFNIVVMKEFVEPVSNTFFARLEISGLLDTREVTAQLAATLPHGTSIQLHPYQKKRKW